VKKLKILGVGEN